MSIDKIINFTIAAAIILGSFKLAGDIDREEHAIVTMSQEEYSEIKDSLASRHNSTPSDSQIADEWYKKKGE